MFKPLLIHKDNTPLVDVVDNYEKFNIDTFDFSKNNLDFYISKKFIPKILKRDFNIIFIKDNLSDNYLELYGIQLAYHIRLSEELEDKRFVPIVIISDVDGYILNKLTPIANILFTKNTFIAKNKKSSFEYFKKFFNQIKKFDDEYDDFKKNFLDLIHIDPPQDYLSHHDISNEWSIYRWAEFLKVESETVKANRAKIENMLYFKYLKATFSVVKKDKFSIIPKSPKYEGNILYIDDEWDKGWKDIFEKYFSKSSNIKFHFIEHNFKDANYEEIEKLVKNDINVKSIDTILLDIRLIQDDFKQKNVKEMSGIKLLKMIKSFNPGIQIILLTASEKSTMLDEANKYNILGYIKKESPSDEVGYTKQVFKKLKNLIDLGFERKYLKEIWQIQKEVLELEMFKNSKFSEMKIEIESIFEILQTDIESKFTYAMLSLFKILEIINNLYTEERKGYAYWKNSNKKIPLVNEDNTLSNINYEKNKDTTNYRTENKIRAILHKKLEIIDKTIHDDIHNFVKVRNNVIHPKKKEHRIDENDVVNRIDENNIINWFKLVKGILTKLNNYKDEI